jgi:Ni,Fe-hydrogenase maturation factor
MSAQKKILVIGFGNPGRLDDGLGPAFVREIEKFKIPNLVTDSN